MMDANQRWEVGETIENMARLAEFDPWWIEEPTCPDDILGHAEIARAIAPIGVATGEVCHNKVRGGEGEGEREREREREAACVQYIECTAVRCVAYTV